MNKKANFLWSRTPFGISTLIRGHQAKPLSWRSFRTLFVFHFCSRAWRALILWVSRESSGRLTLHAERGDVILSPPLLKRGILRHVMGRSKGAAWLRAAPRTCDVSVCFIWVVLFYTRWLSASACWCKYCCEELCVPSGSWASQHYCAGFAKPTAARCFGCVSTAPGLPAHSSWERPLGGLWAGLREQGFQETVAQVAKVMPEDDVLN